MTKIHDHKSESLKTRPSATAIKADKTPAMPSLAKPEDRYISENRGATIAQAAKGRDTNLNATLTSRALSQHISQPYGTQLAPTMSAIAKNFAEMQNRTCKAKRPLILLSEGDLGEKPIEAGSFFDSLPPNSDRSSHVRPLRAFIFDQEKCKDPQEIDFSWALEKGNRKLLRTVLAINIDSVGFDREVEQICLAAIIKSGLFGFSNESLSLKIRDGVSAGNKDEALNAALFLSHGKVGVAIASVLLSWGANINSLDPDDGMSLLIDALSRKDVAMVRFLVENGADTSSALGPHPAAESLVLENSYRDLAPLLQGKAGN